MFGVLVAAFYFRLAKELTGFVVDGVLAADICLRHSIVMIPLPCSV